MVSGSKQVFAAQLPQSVGRSARRRIPGLFALVGALFVALPASGQVQQDAPADLDLARFRGKVVYVDFWASWCGPCQESFPWMSELVRRLPETEFALIAVNVDHQREKADAFLKRVGGHVPVIFDPDGKIARSFGVKGMPSSFVVGRDGKTLFSHQGFYPEQEASYEAHISEALRAR